MKTPTYVFIPVESAPKPTFNLAGLVAGLIYSALVAGFFVGLGAAVLWVVQKVAAYL